MSIFSSKFAIILATSTLMAAPAWAANPGAAGTKLQFTDLGGVKTWKAGGDTVVFVKNRAEEWYRADMLETCMKLDTSKGVDFITELNPDTNQKQSKVVVDHHICLVTSLQKVDAADVKAK